MADVPQLLVFAPVQDIKIVALLLGKVNKEA